MKKSRRERLTVTFNQSGVELRCAGKKSIELGASEALMLLDILRNEQGRLERMARRSSPLPVRVKL